MTINIGRATLIIYNFACTTGLCIFDAIYNTQKGNLIKECNIEEYDETFFEGAKREVKEETNLDVDDLELFNVADDIQLDRHYITLQVIFQKSLILEN